MGNFRYSLQDSCRDEYGDRLDESGGMDSSPAARDFWAPGSKKLLHKTDAVYVLDHNSHVLDAVMLTEDTKAHLLLYSSQEDISLIIPYITEI